MQGSRRSVDPVLRGPDFQGSRAGGPCSLGAKDPTLKTVLAWWWGPAGSQVALRRTAVIGGNVAQPEAGNFGSSRNTLAMNWLVWRRNGVGKT